MIVITRSFARLLRAVLRRSFWASHPPGYCPAVLIGAEEKGLYVVAASQDVAVAYLEPGSRPTDLVVITTDGLRSIEGTGDEPVTLERGRGDKVRATWKDGADTRTLNLPSNPPGAAKDFKAPAKWSPLPAEFLTAFAAAADTAADDAARFALHRVLLSGKSGEVLGSDGQSLYLHGGFRFPFPDDLLVYRIGAFGVDGLLAEGDSVGVARDESHLFLKAGRWTFRLSIDKDGRFPDVRTVIPRPRDIVSRLRLDDGAAAQLLRQVPRASRNGDRPLTLELGQRPALHFYAGELGPHVSVELKTAETHGASHRVCLDHDSFRRIVHLGFREFHVASPTRPVVCHEGKRLFVLMPKDPSLAIDPSAVPETREEPASPVSVPDVTPNEERSTPPMRPNPLSGPSPERPENGNGHASPPPGIQELLAEAEQIRALLQDSTGRLARLINGLRQNRKQGQAVRAAVASLRQLKLDG